LGHLLLLGLLHFILCFRFFSLISPVVGRSVVSSQFVAACATRSALRSSRSDVSFAAYLPSEEGDDVERFSDGFRVECLEIVDDIRKGH
jgi:hypothetical protein